MSGDLPGTFVFDGARSRAGYALNKLASSLIKPENRAAFLADEAAYMTRFELPEAHKLLLRARDWHGLIRAGGNVYLILKVAGTLGSNLIAMGAQMRGQTVAEFLATRPGADGVLRRDGG